MLDKILKWDYFNRCCTKKQHAIQLMKNNLFTADIIIIKAIAIIISNGLRRHA